MRELYMGFSKVSGIIGRHLGFGRRGERLVFSERHHTLLSLQISLQTPGSQRYTPFLFVKHRGDSTAITYRLGSRVEMWWKTTRW